jgi:uncharacterized membrane protein
MGMLRALRERMRNASAQTAELKQSASSSARAKELERLVERHEQGLIDDEEFEFRRTYLER